MRWSWTIGRIAGIELRVHATFLLLVGWIAIVSYQRTATAAGAVAGVLFILALFASVILHELGHALTARRFGVGTREITLLPIGGVAQLERVPSEPRQELLVALAGPGVTVVVVLALAALMVALGSPPTSHAALTQSDAPFLAQLLWANIVLAVFNLLPAFPMDGGRVLRAALALRVDYARATDIAAGVGKAFALLFGIVGLFSNPFLVLIALFVWVGAAGEAGATQTHSVLGGVPVQRAMITDLRTLAPGDPLSRAVEYLLAGFQQDMPVVDAQGAVVGMLTRGDLVRALAARGAGASVAEVMERTFETTTPGEPLEGAVARLQACRCRTMPVVLGGSLVGLLTAENVAEYVMVRSALERDGRGR